MPYCAKCGVELDVGVLSCPLCAFEMPPLGEKEPPERPRYPETQERYVAPTGRQIRMAIWAAASAVFVISFLVVVAVNLVWTGGSLTWGGPAMASIGVAWIAATTILILFRRPWLVVLSNYLPVVGFLALVDLFDGGLDWFLPLGLPIATASFLVPIVSLILWMFWKDRGANQLAILLCLVAALFVGIDFAASGYLGQLGISWSLVVAAVLIPLSGFLFVYHYVLRRFLKLKRVFHL